MAFKMKGFNPGKGTGIGNGFSRVTLNPGTRDDPEGITVGTGEGQSSGTVDNETYKDLRKKEKTSENNQMMFDDLKNRLEEYKKDDYRVEVGPKEAYNVKPGLKTKAQAKMFSEWLDENEDNLKRDGKLRYNWKKGDSFPNNLRTLFEDKVDEAINIDNDLKMSAEQGYGFDEEQLQDYGVYGMDGYLHGGDAEIADGGKYKVTQGLDAYAPDPVLGGNVEANKEKLELENIKRVGNERMARIKEAIKEGEKIPSGDLNWLETRGPSFDIPEFSEFINNTVVPYEQHTSGGTKKSIKTTNQLTDLLESGVPIDKAYAQLGMTAPSVKDDPAGLDLSSDSSENTDEVTTMMDQDIANMNTSQTEVPTETETKQEEFDPRDTNKDGDVDRKERRAAMFADASAPQSAMTKWNNSRLQSMTKETLMNADRNPYKFGSKEHEEYTNNKSRAKGLKIKQRYNKFL